MKSVWVLLVFGCISSAALPGAEADAQAWQERAVGAGQAAPLPKGPVWFRAWLRVPDNMTGTDGAELDADKGFVPPAFDGLAHQHFVVAVAVKISGIEEIDSFVQCLPDSCDALGFVRPLATPGRGHSHTS